jgi:hypothetical protein
MKRRARFQQTLASQASFAKYGRKSKRELFLDQMNQVVPWSELLALVEPVYPKAGNGRQPVGVSIMLRTYFLQQWFGFSDPGMEEAFYDSPLLQRFAGVDLGVAAAPDETTILRFRHLLKQHDLCGEMLMTVNRYLETKGKPVGNRENRGSCHCSNGAPDSPYCTHDLCPRGVCPSCPFVSGYTVDRSFSHSVITPFGAWLFGYLPYLHFGDAHLTAGSDKLQGSRIQRSSQQRRDR